MATAVIIGDGPGGLSAALFLARADVQSIVLGQDETPMHIALLNNYLGIHQITGSDFQQRAKRQVQAAGVQVITAEVTAVERRGAGFAVSDAEGGEHLADYLVLASGGKRDLAEALGAVVDSNQGVVVDRNGRTGVDRLYAVGRAARPYKTQAVIAAGDGAAAALDIVSREGKKPYRDWDVVEPD